MVRGSDRKGNKNKCKSPIKGGIVNQLEEIPDEISDGEEIQEGDQEKSQDIDKNKTHRAREDQ